MRLGIELLELRTVPVGSNSCYEHLNGRSDSHPLYCACERTFRILLPSFFSFECQPPQVIGNTICSTVSRINSRSPALVLKSHTAVVPVSAVKLSANLASAALCERADSRGYNLLLAAYFVKSDHPGLGPIFGNIVDDQVAKLQHERTVCLSSTIADDCEVIDLTTASSAKKVYEMRNCTVCSGQLHLGYILNKVTLASVCFSCTTLRSGSQQEDEVPMPDGAAEFDVEGYAIFRGMQTWETDAPSSDLFFKDTEGNNCNWSKPCKTRKVPRVCAGPTLFREPTGSPPELCVLFCKHGSLRIKLVKKSHTKFGFFCAAHSHRLQQKPSTCFKQELAHLDWCHGTKVVTELSAGDALVFDSRHIISWNRVGTQKKLDCDLNFFVPCPGSTLRSNQQLELVSAEESTGLLSARGEHGMRLRSMFMDPTPTADITAGSFQSGWCIGAFLIPPLHTGVGIWGKGEDTLLSSSASASCSSNDPPPGPPEPLHGRPSPRSEHANLLAPELVEVRQTDNDITVQLPEHGTIVVTECKPTDTVNYLKILIPRNTSCSPYLQQPALFPCLRRTHSSRCCLADVHQNRVHRLPTLCSAGPRTCGLVAPRCPSSGFRPGQRSRQVAARPVRWCAHRRGKQPGPLRR